MSICGSVGADVGKQCDQITLVAQSNTTLDIAPAANTIIVIGKRFVHIKSKANAAACLAVSGGAKRNKRNYDKEMSHVSQRFPIVCFLKNNSRITHRAQE